MENEIVSDRPVSRWLLAGLSLLSAVLLPLSLPNQIFHYGNAAVGFVCLVPAFIAVSLAPTFGFASLLGVLFGAVSTGLADFWLMFFQGYSVWTYGGVIVGYIGYNSLLFPFLRGFARVRPRYRPFLLAMTWAVYEYFKSIGFLGFPWGLVAYPASDILPLIQFIDTTGIWGLSFLMALINAVIAEGALFAFKAAPPWDSLRVPPTRWDWGRLARQAGFVAVIIALVLAYGFYRLGTPIPSRGTTRLLLVQQNIDPWNEGKAVTDSVTISEDLTTEAIRATPDPVDLVLWSESSVSSIWVVNGNQFKPRENSLEPFARSIGTYLLFGGVVALDINAGKFMNAAVLLSPEGKILDTYGKMHPVPFAENVPLYEYPAVRKLFKDVFGIWNVWTMGDRFTIFRIPLRNGGTLSAGAPICFEDAFSDLCRRFILSGADMWLNLTNDYWSKTASSEIQHFQVARFRAVENRRVLVRSTNGGVTTVVGPWGNIMTSLPLFEREWTAVDVPVYREDRLTAYTLFGDYFPWVLAAILLIVLAADRLAREPAFRETKAPEGADDGRSRRVEGKARVGSAGGRR